MLFDGRILQQRALESAASREYLIWHQPLMEGYGDEINQDIYAINIQKLPNGFTAEQLFEHIRLNLVDFTNGATDLEPYDSKSGEIWQSQYPLGAIMHFDVSLIGAPGLNLLTQGEDLTVVSTDVSRHHWVFTTVHSMYNFAHPLSGNRHFGLSAEEDGSYTFYLRATDRPYRMMDAAISSMIFYGADDLWNAIMQNVAYWINESGGQAVQTHSFSRQISASTDYQAPPK